MTKRSSLRRRRLVGRPAAALTYAAVAIATCPCGPAPPAAAGELDGVTMPDLLQVAGTPLRLNGMGLRTYTLFRIHIYVAGLYLPQRSSDAQAILHSDSLKLLDVRFVHDASAARVRDAWRKGFRQNCAPPCHLPPADEARFLAAVPDFHKGDETTMLFEAGTVSFSLNGRALGTITDPTFTRTILATFIGADPPSEPFKHGLLGLHN